MVLWVVFHHLSHYLLPLDESQPEVTGGMGEKEKEHLGDLWRLWNCQESTAHQKQHDC